MSNEKLRKKDNNVLTEYAAFDTVETYKTIRTNLMFSMPKTEEGKVISVTSSIPNEGKTTTTINLAITFAQMGAKVIIIDCDLRKSRVHRYLGIDRSNGLSNLLCGFIDLQTAIKRNVRANLDCITAGEIPPNPAELLESDVFKAILDTLRQEYDYIFIDTTPMVIVTDAAVVVKQSNGVVVVVKQNLATYDVLDAAMDNIRRTGVRVLGFVMTGCEEKRRSYSYYKNKSKYGYRYADATKSKNN